MIILTREDVELSRIQHPSKDVKVTILTYQGQNFRLISVFAASQAQDAKNFWRDLTDNQGKFCVLLQEPEKHSVWGRINLDQLGSDVDVDKLDDWECCCCTFGVTDGCCGLFSIEFCVFCFE